MTLVFSLTALDLQNMAVAVTADLILVIAVQFLGSFVPGDGDLWGVDLDPTLKGSGLVLSRDLVSNVLQHRDWLRVQKLLYDQTVHTNEEYTHFILKRVQPCFLLQQTYLDRIVFKLGNVIFCSMMFSYL